MGAQFRLRRPTAEALEAASHDRQDVGLSYEAVEATRGGEPPVSPLGADGETELGRGEAVWQAAVDRLLDRTMFNRAGFALPTTVAVSLGHTFAYGMKVGPLWSINVCRVVYLDGDRDGACVAFGHGTLPTHGVRGEERFSVRRDADERVFFSIAQCSWPSNWTVALGRPVVRQLQAAFIRESCAHFAKATSESAL